MRVAAVLAALTLAAPLAAQTVITVRPPSSARVIVAPGAPVNIPIVVDMSAAGGANVADVHVQLLWDPNILTPDSSQAGGFGTFSTSGAASSTIVFDATSGGGITTTFTLGTKWLTAGPSGSTRFRLIPIGVNDQSLNDLFSITRVRDVDVCIGPPTKWGDANNDNNINIIDAQQLARFSVGLSVANSAVTMAQGDVNADNNINIIDAQQVARFSVGLSATARVNTIAFQPATVSTMSVSAVYDALGGSFDPTSSASLGGLSIGAQAQIEPIAQDVNTNDVTSCAAITYSSDNPAVATVSAGGLIDAVSSGSATITIASGSASTTLLVTVGAGGFIANTWTNTSGGLWSVASNWSLGRVPTTSDSVVINAPGIYTVTMDVDPVVPYILLGGSGAQTLSMTSRAVAASIEFTVTGGGVVVARNGSITTGVIDNAGTFNVEGTLTLNGSFVNLAGGTLRVRGVSGCCNTNLSVSGGVTNDGFVELTSITGFASATLTVVGTLLNTPTGTISSLVGATGNRTIAAPLDNRGVLSVAAAVTLQKASAQHDNSGTINITGGTLSLVQSGTVPRLTSSGAINVASGTTLSVSGGTFTAQASSSIGGPGTLSLVSAANAVINAPLAIANLSVTSSSIALGQATTTAGMTVSLVSSSMSGANTLTNPTGQVISARNTVLNIPIDNSGTLLLEGTTPLNSGLTTSTTSVIQVNGVSGCCNGAVTVATGFTNNGVISLSSTVGSATSTLTVTSGTLINAAGASINILAGAAGARTLAAQLDNQGTLTTTTSASLSKANAVHTNSGGIDIQQGVFTVNQTGASAPSLTSSGSINVRTGTTFVVSGGTFTHQIGAGLNGAGTMNLTSTTANLNSAFGLGAVTMSSANVNIATAQTTSGMSWSMISSTLSGVGSFTNIAGQSMTIRASTINTTFDNQGSLFLEGTSSFTNAFTTSAGSLLQVQGVGGCCNATVTFANAFTNNGDIVLTSITSSAGVTLAVSGGALLTNALGATITVQSGVGGARTFAARLDNQGTFTNNVALQLNNTNGNGTSSGPINVNADLTVQQGVANVFTVSGPINIAAGQTFTVNQGVFTQSANVIGGAGALSITNAASATFNGAVSPAAVTLVSSSGVSFATALSSASTVWTITSSTVTAPSFTNANGATTGIRGSTINMPIVNQGVMNLEASTVLNGAITTTSTSTLRVQGISGVASATVTVANGFTNNGLFEMTSLLGVANATFITASGTLSNSASGTISILTGAGGARFFNTPVANAGQFTVGTNTSTGTPTNSVHTNSGTLSLTGGDLTITQVGVAASYTNSGTISIGNGLTLTVSGGAFNHNAAATLGGAGTLALSGTTSGVMRGAHTLGGISLASNATTTWFTPQSNASTTWTINNGTLGLIAGGTATFTNVLGKTQTFRNAFFTIPVTNNGVLIMESGSSLAAFTNPVGSTLRVQGVSGCCSANLGFTQPFTNDGLIELTTIVGAAAATLGSAGVNIVNSGTGTISILTGFGTTGRIFNSPLDNRGTLNVFPGAAGTVTFNAALTDTAAASVINMEIGGAAPGTGYDQLIVNGGITPAGGTVNWALINGFTPTSGQQFILFAGAHTGQFATENKPAVNWPALQYLTTQIISTAP